MKPDWQIRYMRPDDEPGIRALFAKAFGHEISSEFWYWQFIDNRFSRPIVYVADTPDGEIVGHYSLIPLPLWNHRKVHKAGYSIYSMIDPRYQRQGMIKALAKAADKQIEEDRIKYGVTFLNENSFPVYTRSLGWTPVEGDLPVYFNILDIAEVLGSRLSSPLAGKILGTIVSPLTSRVFKHVVEKDAPPIKEVTHFSASFDRLWESFRQTLHTSIDRNSEYLNWRYCRNPKNYSIYAYIEDERLFAFSVIRKDSKFGQSLGYLADFVYHPDHPGKAVKLLKYTNKKSKSAGASIMTALCYGPRSYAKLLHAAGYYRLPGMFLPHQIYFCVKSLFSGQQRINDPKQWFVSWSDHDVV